MIRPTSDLADRIDATFAAPVRAPFSAEAAGPPPGFAAAVVDSLQNWSDDDPFPSEAVPPPPEAAPPRAAPPPPEFGRVVSLLREHPAVLRALGLIFELRVDLPPDRVDGGTVSVQWSNAGTGVPVVASPFTLFGRAFRPLSRSGMISAGMVALTPDPADPASASQDGGWAVVTVDVEGGARRLRETAQALEGDAAADPRATISLPALRTAGLQLVRVGRGRDFARRRANAATNRDQDIDEHVFDADELVLGYRIDVKRGGGELALTT